MKISDIRKDYGKFKLDDSSIEKDPFKQFDKWFKEGLEGDFYDPTAFILSTATKDALPSSRVLLLKKYDDKGFIFYSNYDSRKGKEIQENPNASMLFYYDKFERQIRIEGKLEQISKEESFEYYKTRPYPSRIGAWASEQSSELKSRFTLMRKVAGLMLKYPKNPPLPNNWGGYRLKPVGFEFWQGRESRLHDRFRFDKTENGWDIKRLSP